MIEMTDNVVTAPCNLCGHNTEHDVIFRKNTSTNQEISQANSITEVLSCRGCRDISVRKINFSERNANIVQEYMDESQYIPPRLWRRPPNWLVELEQYDPDLKDLLEEVYSATHSKQMRLLSMGVRSALDYVMRLILKKDDGSFQQKLSDMVREGHLTSNQAGNIEIVIDAGSAATHRGFKPPRELLEEMVTVMENLVREYYITGPMLQTAKVNIPARPPRRRKKNPVSQSAK